jgi:hypothetical protein
MTLPLPPSVFVRPTVSVRATRSSCHQHSVRISFLRNAVFSTSVTTVESSRRCAELRYASEGGYLHPGLLLRGFGNLPRPECWLPYVFTSIDDPCIDEVLRTVDP